jgi:hypothetical protein
VDESTKALLRALAEASLRIGSANDLLDRGDPDGSRELREDAQRTIAGLVAAASPDDTARIDAIFGPDLASHCDQHTWTRVYDYARHLLERDPELPVERLRGRHAAFDGRIDDLRDAADASEARWLLRYTLGVPWMPNTICALLQRGGERLVTYYARLVSWDLDLAGNGVRIELRRSGREPCDALIDGVLVHVELDRASAQTGTAVSLRSRDRAALERVARELHAALVADGWEDVPG